MAEFTVATTLPVDPARAARAWVEEHAAMTGSPATRDGDAFTAWGGYIRGRYTRREGLDLAMTWRTSQFPPDHPDSEVRVGFAPEGGGCRVTLTHTGMPPDQASDYESGWEEHYFAPMRAYFRSG